MSNTRLITLLALGACLTANAADYSGTLPVMFINTEGGEPVTTKEYYLKGTYYIDNMGHDEYESIGSEAAPLPLQIKGRGNYSWAGFDKKPYRLKLDKKADLLGLGSNRHFALLAHADDTYGFLRNPMGFYLSRTLQMPWTPGEEPVEVVLNGDYIGLYFLTETIRVDKNRVNVIEQADYATDPEEITGGWLVEIDNYRDDPHIVVKEGDGEDIIFTYKSPEELSEQQTAYLTDQMQTINAEIYSPDKQQCAWAEHVDLETLAKFYIVQEVMDNYESFHGSCYLNKQRGADQKWMFGPVWDFGSAFNYSKSQYIYQGREHHNTWIAEMCKFPAFMDVVKTIWTKFYSEEYYPMLDYAQAYADRISAAAACDARRWPQYGNADEQAKANLVKQRLRTSCAWLATQWGGQQQEPDLQPFFIYYIDDDANPWTRVYAYSWDQGPDGEYNLFGYWPGTEMTPTTVDGKAGYCVLAQPIIELGPTPGLIFNNGKGGAGNQTADLTLYRNHVYLRDGTNWAGTADAIAPVDTGVKPVDGGILVTSQGTETVTIASMGGIAQKVAVGPGQTKINLPRGFYIVSGRKIAVTR